MNAYRLILGSGSPRRKVLLEEMGYVFEVQVIETDEHFLPSLPVEEVASFVARNKALAFPAEMLTEPCCLLTCDTTVVVDDQILNKPANEEEALQMLRRLSDRKHRVITGVCLRDHKKIHLFSETTWVSFKALSEEEMLYYIRTYKPFDKAGGYGIQEWIGAIGIKGIEGSYTNVMGLPTHRLYEEMKRFVKSN